MTTPEEMTALYARIWNAGDFDAIRDIAHHDFTFRGALGKETKGYDGFIAYARSMRASLGGYHCDILTCVCEGDQSFAEMRYGGRHVEPFFGFDPTNQFARLRSSDHHNAALTTR